MIYQERIKGVP